VAHLEMWVVVVVVEMRRDEKQRLDWKTVRSAASAFDLRREVPLLKISAPRTH
jgi:hypothetical protein